jgi:hypothetical protein
MQIKLKNKSLYSQKVLNGMVFAERERERERGNVTVFSVLRLYSPVREAAALFLTCCGFFMHSSRMIPVCAMSLLPVFETVKQFV